MAERAPSLQGPGAQTINGIISKFKPSDAEALERFADEAAVVQPQRGMESFASTWKFLARFAPQHNELADGLFVYRVSNQIRGAMTVSNGPNALEVGQLEGLGEGAGTRLLQSAVQESIRRGYNGRLMLESADQAIRFYEKLGFVLSDPRYNVYTLSEQAAQALLQR